MPAASRLHSLRSVCECVRVCVCQLEWEAGVQVRRCLASNFLVINDAVPPPPPPPPPPLALPLTFGWSKLMTDISVSGGRRLSKVGRDAMRKNNCRTFWKE